jgi:hypothetical protein
MSNAGTLLSDLADKPGVGDDDLVQKIFAEMNGPSGGNTMQPPALAPAPSARASMAPGLAPIGAMSQIAMDPTASTAHMIGGQHPTPADFAHAMYASGQGAVPMNPYLQMQPPQAFQPVQEPQHSIWSSISMSLTREMKTPLLVALIVFVVSLPFINTMIGLYMPSLLRMGGDLTTVGLALKSLLGGALFWILNRIVAPLI